MCILTWAWPVKDSMGNCQSCYPYGPDTRWQAKLSLQVWVFMFMSNWSVFVWTKTSNWRFFLPDVYSLKLLPTDTSDLGNSFSCAVPNIHTELSGCVNSIREPYLIQDSLYEYLSFLHFLINLRQVRNPMHTTGFCCCFILVLFLKEMKDMKLGGQGGSEDMGEKNMIKSYCMKKIGNYKKK